MFLFVFTFLFVYVFIFNFLYITLHYFVCNDTYTLNVLIFNMKQY